MIIQSLPGEVETANLAIPGHSSLIDALCLFAYAYNIIEYSGS